MLAIERGIEIGHVFYLGTKYSKAMNATFLDVNGKPQFMEMGCYGIGITRLPAAAIEQNHDDKGIIWPDALAPFTVVLCPISPDRFPDVKAASDTLYAELLAAGVDVILDDRNERPGAMFADWELIGVPHRVNIGDRGLKEGMVEYQHRRDAAATKRAGWRDRGAAAVQTAGMTETDGRAQAISSRRTCLSANRTGGLGGYAAAAATGVGRWPAGRTAGRCGARRFEFGHPATPRRRSLSSQTPKRGLKYLRWLGVHERKAQEEEARVDVRRKEFLQTVWYESKRAGLDVALVLGLIQVESGFRKYAVSIVGARGYMQVMPFWTRSIGDGDAGKLFHMQTNLRFGCVILRHYLEIEKGDLFLALGRYNGSRGKAPYPNAVLAAKKLLGFLGVAGFNFPSP